MDKTKALAELIAKVEAGEWQHTDWPTVEKGFWGNWNEAALHFQLAFNGSLDAAKALHEAVLPGWSPSVGQNAHHGYWFATVMRAENGTIAADTTGTGPCPARAWLLAILRALHAQADTAQ